MFVSHFWHIASGSLPLSGGRGVIDISFPYPNTSDSKLLKDFRRRYRWIHRDMIYTYMYTYSVNSMHSYIILCVFFVMSYDLLLGYIMSCYIVYCVTLLFILYCITVHYIVLYYYTILFYSIILYFITL